MKSIGPAVSFGFARAGATTLVLFLALASPGPAGALENLLNTDFESDMEACTEAERGEELWNIEPFQFVGIGRHSNGASTPCPWLNIGWGGFPGTVYAATGGGLSTSTDYGANFTNHLVGKLVLGAYAGGSQVYAATTVGLSVSRNSGSTFTNKTTIDGLGDELVYGVYAVAPAAADPHPQGDTVYAATHGGLSISPDYGTSFTNRTQDGHGLGSDIVYGVYAVDPAAAALQPQPDRVYAATDGGLSISTDGGDNFVNRTTANDLGSNIVRGVYVVAGDDEDPLSMDTVYAATSNGLSISTDGGVNFTNRTQAANDLGSNDVRGVYVVAGDDEDPLSMDTVYAATSNGLSISTNGGDNFTNLTQAANDLGSNDVRGVHVVGSTVSAATSVGLSISTNGGVNFTNRTQADDGLESNDVRGVYAVGGTSTWREYNQSGRLFDTDGTRGVHPNALGSGNRDFLDVVDATPGKKRWFGGRHQSSGLGGDWLGQNLTDAKRLRVGREHHFSAQLHRSVHGENPNQGTYCLHLSNYLLTEKLGGGMNPAVLLPSEADDWQGEGFDGCCLEFTDGPPAWQLRGGCTFTVPNQGEGLRAISDVRSIILKPKSQLEEGYMAVIGIDEIVVEDSCGDGVVDQGEECDDGNNIDGDCCSATCLFEVQSSICGAAATECSAQDSCDGAGACQANDLAETEACGNAGTECINQDFCDGVGGCSDYGFQVVGTNCGDTGTECTNQDSCDGAGACTDNGFQVVGTNCGDTGTECTNQDSCDAFGSCTDNGFQIVGTNCGDTGTECTNQDSCDAIGSCTDNGFQIVGTNCGDTGTECTNQDSCDAIGSCTDNGFQVVGTNCGDTGTECTNQDSCDAFGSCTNNGFQVVGTNCGDTGTECTNQDSCDAFGSCTDNGFRIVGTNCGDTGTDCVVQDSCDGAGSCTDNGFVMALTVCVDEGIDCTSDLCDGAGVCVHTPVDALCDNELFCDGVETCGASGCQAGTPPDPEDGVDCTDDTCDEDTDDFVHTANHAKCDNGEACEVWACDLVNGCVGEEVVCDDGVACTVDTCTADENNNPLCVYSLEPRQDCAEATKAHLLVSNPLTQSNPVLKATILAIGTTYTTDDIGVPPAQPSVEDGMSYSLCLWDRENGTPMLWTELVIQPGLGWRILDRRSMLKFSARRNLHVHGVRAFKAIGGEHRGRTGALIKATGEAVPLGPNFDEETIFAQDPYVEAQIVNSNGTCWAGKFDAASVRRNSLSKFVAKVR